jgi:hypothetical protein
VRVERKQRQTAAAKARTIKRALFMDAPPGRVAGISVVRPLEEEEKADHLKVGSEKAPG